MEIEKTKYIEATSLAALSSKVNDAIDQGWQQVGDLIRNGENFAREVVKYKKPQADRPFWSTQSH